VPPLAAPAGARPTRQCLLLYHHPSSLCSKRMPGGERAEVDDTLWMCWAPPGVVSITRPGGKATVTSPVGKAAANTQINEDMVQLSCPAAGLMNGIIIIITSLLQASNVRAMHASMRVCLFGSRTRSIAMITHSRSSFLSPLLLLLSWLCMNERIQTKVGR
jgi:hypothetical protein